MNVYFPESSSNTASFSSTRSNSTHSAPPTVFKMLVVNTADIRAADGRGLHPDENLAVPRWVHAIFTEPRCAVARENGTPHGVGDGYSHISQIYCAMTPSRSQRSSQPFAHFHRNTCPLMSRQLRSILATLSISSGVSGSPTTARKFAM